jgi:GNAT superfamily N-acetyltransferase
MTAVRRSDRALAEQICEFESLEFGVAYFSGRLPASIQTNQLRDVWLADVSPEVAFDRAESFYRERNLTCLAWSPASGQAIEPIEHLLTGKGWRRVEHVAMSMEHGELLDGSADPQIRVLPARAMPKALHETFGGDEAAFQIAAERLNDSHLDPFVATFDKTPAGRVGYLEVGDVARLSDLFVVPEMRGKGVGKALLSHVYQMARRLLPKAVVLSIPATRTREIDLLSRKGFAQSGTTTQFVREPK